MKYRIPSESQAPAAVREALASVSQNIYAEGYPDEESRWMTEEEILEAQRRLAGAGYFVEPAAATSLAAVRKLRAAGKIGEED